MKEALRFYLLATTLKNKIRQGSIYWDVSAPRRESIAEHIYDTCILAIAIDSEANLNIDIKKVIQMLVIHELEEIIIGDITPFDNVTEEEKLKLGKKAVMDILGNLAKKEEYIALTDEFNEKSSKEACFAYFCDKADFVIQMMLYSDSGYIKLGGHETSPVFKNPKIQKMIQDGAKTPNDIFYLYDIEKFKNSPEFTELLNLAYSLDLKDYLDKLLK